MLENYKLNEKTRKVIVEMLDELKTEDNTSFGLSKNSMSYGSEFDIFVELNVFKNRKDVLIYSELDKLKQKVDQYELVDSKLIYIKSFNTILYPKSIDEDEFIIRNNHSFYYY